MFSASVARHSVKVVAASLVESLPLSTQPTSLHYATLSFHLHRSSLTEPFGVSCAFGVPGHNRNACFLRSIAPSLATSSTVLGSLIEGGKPSAPDALLVVRVNGEVSPTEARLAAVMTEGRDVQLECAVVNAARTHRAADGEEGEEQVDDEEEVIESDTLPTPKKRGRKPMKAAEEMEEVGEDEAAAGAPTKKRRGRRPASSKPSPRRVLKRARNKGSRAAVTDEASTAAQETPDAHRASFEEDEAADALGDLAGDDAAAAGVTEEVMEALESISPATELPLKRRRRRTKAEMAAARLAAASEGEAEEEVGERKRGGGRRRRVAPEAAEGDAGEEEEEAWFRTGNEDSNEEEGEDVEAVEDVPVATKKGRRGRSVVTAKGGDENALVPRKRGKRAKKGKKMMKARRTRKAKASAEESMPSTAAAAATASTAVSADSDAVEEKEEENEGEDMAF